MITLGRVLLTERLRMRRTAAVKSAVIVPLASLLCGGARTAYSTPQVTSQGFASAFALSVLQFWVVFGMPLMVLLVAAEAVSVERHSRMWIWLNALPVSRRRLVLAKTLAISGLTLLSVGLLGVTLFVITAIIAVVLPQSTPVEWELRVRQFGMLVIETLPLSLASAWLSFRLRSQAAVVAIGFGSAMAVVLLLRGVWRSIWPWTIPAAVTMPGADSPRIILHSVVLALLLLAAISIDEPRRKPLP